ncbi:uncharacterized protein [Palaemon carinicauda]|uniref:uncharacterized protein n=1 Tax=Palaemon carinicauda TaxID=392227 RepID=UPI0035B5EC96
MFENTIKTLNMIVMSENIILTCALLFSCFVFAIAHPGGHGLEAGSQKLWHGWEDTGQPSLAREQINMTAILGHTVSLPCRVINLRDRTVSWIRSRDLTVLAVEKITVTTDARISVSIM